ncbi:protease complex subunit PrcB family protein [Roseburia zhanii]|nr:protease complex subunit PrcB family protein [Roseburia zhanii]
MKDVLKESESTGCRLLLYMAALLMITVLVTLFGCGIEKTDGNRLQDLEYEIIEDEIPKELAEKIEEKKSADFKLTYENDKYLYIVRGYGEQETGGYSIQILDLYLTQNAVVLHTNLKGPSKDEVKNAAPSYPYIVIRIEHTDKNVIFQ